MSVDLKVITVLETSPLWYLATSHEGEPNVVPIGFKWVERDRLLIADLFFGKTRANLGKNLRVAVSVGLLDPKRGFQVKATAKVHRDGPVFEHVCQLLRSAGVSSAPFAALEIPFEEIYNLDPGPEAGKRIS